MIKRTTFLILIAIMAMTPSALSAQEAESLYQGWGLGFELGAGAIMPGGSLKDDLKSCALFQGGLNAEYRRLRLKADVAFGQPSFKNENPYALVDDNGRNMQLNATANPTLLGLGLQLGYTVWRQGRVSVTPLVGMSWSRLSWDLNNIKYEKDDEGEERPMIDNVVGTHESSFGWMASIDIDFKLHGKIVDNPFGDNQAHYISSIRVAPFVSYAKYSRLNPAVKGTCFGATISYAGFLRLFD